MDSNLNTTPAKNSFPQCQGEICIGSDFKWVLDGIELRKRHRIDLQIGGHWIPGVLIDPNDRLVWSSWADCVSVQIVPGLRARWTDLGVTPI